MVKEIDPSVADTEDVDEGEDEETDFDTEPEDTDKTDWKAEAAKARRIASRYRNKFIKATEAKKDAEPEEKQESKKETATGSLDFAQKAFLAASHGIKGAKEVAFVEQYLKDTGKDLESLVEAKWFKSELEEFRENAQAKEGTPRGNKRAGTPDSSSPEYWASKIEAGTARLGDITDQALRQKVVNYRLEKAKRGPFYNS